MLYSRYAFLWHKTTQITERSDIEIRELKIFPWDARGLNEWNVRAKTSGFISVLLTGKQDVLCKVLASVLSEFVLAMRRQIIRHWLRKDVFYSKCYKTDVRQTAWIVLRAQLGFRNITVIIWKSLSLTFSLSLCRFVSVNTSKTILSKVL